MAGKWLGPAVLLATIAAPAAAKERRDAFLKFGDNMEAPRGFTEMCSNDRAVCDKMAEPIATPPASPLAASSLSVETATLGSVDVLPVEQVDDGNTFSPRYLSDPACSPLTEPSIFAPRPILAGSIERISAPGGFRLPLDTASFFLPSQLGLASLAAKDLQSPTMFFTRPIFRPFNLLTLPNASTVAPIAPRMTQSTSPQEPAATPTSPAMTTKALKQLLKRVNARVNANVSQQSDERIYGQAELWRPSGDDQHATGDCEDIAIQKRLDLIDAKFPADRLFFAVVYRSGIGLHTVLVARLDDGDVLLDSRVNYVQKWSSAGYSWVSAQSPASPTVWHALV